MFWARGNFSNVEKIVANSFHRNGYKLNVWTYGDIPNVPSRATLKDAREILPESLFFSLPNGSCAPFSDLFRYAVLNKVGGLWVDTDVIALKSAQEIPAFPFLVTERHRVGRIKRLAEVLRGNPSSQVVNNVIFNPAPASGNIIDLAYLYSERFPKEKVKWGELGPSLLHAIEKIYPDHGFRIMGPDFANALGYWMCPKILLKPGVKLPSEAFFFHLYNQTWRDAHVDKNGEFPKGSLMAFFAKEYL